jgi:hypothetical protein
MAQEKLSLLKEERGKIIACDWAVKDTSTSLKGL